MAVAPPQIAQSALPAGAAEKFAGRWIAIRHGEIIADAATMEDLTADEGVRDDDTLYHVPQQNSAFF
jgi:hypothetical protein